MSEVSGFQPFVAALEAGLSPIPVDTATKRPLTQWKMYQSEPADLLQCQEWEGQNIGIVCGQVSGRLLCIDFEAGFMDQLPEFVERLKADECYMTFYGWVGSYCENTPSGGMHVLVHLEGQGPLDGNTKLASDKEGKTLVETRAEGGYVIVAPSRNGSKGWTLTHGEFARIAWATLEEWAQVASVLRSFDSSPQRPDLAHPSLVVATTPDILRLGESWIEEALASLPTMERMLGDLGWTHVGGDQYGTHWVRPGKDPREGHSASVSHEKHRLWVHSTNAGLPTNVSMDVVDLIWCSDGRSLPSLDERTAYLRNWYNQLPRHQLGTQAEAYLRAQRPPAERGAGAAPIANEVADLNLPSEFWESRPYLAHINQAALARRLSPDALWEAVKCFYAAAIPWNHRLPGDGTMDYISIIVGPSGAGKSRAKQEAYNLLADLHEIRGVRFPAPVGSGEGMTAAYLNKEESPKYLLRGIGWYADEAKFVLDIASRPGNTTMQAIKQMWSGELTGSVAATAERHRWLDPRDVRGTLLMSVTPGVATRFLGSDLSDEGLPQRVSWGWAVYAHNDDKPDHPGQLRLPIFDHNRATGGPYEIGLDQDLSDLVDARQLALARGQGEGLEGHATYATLKTAAILAHMDGRMAVNLADWTLGEQDWQVTGSIRRHLLASADHAIQDRNTATGVARAYSKLAETDVYLEKAVISLVNKIRRAKEPFTMRQVKDHLRTHKIRHGIDHREVLDLAIVRELLIFEGGFVRTP